MGRMLQGGVDSAETPGSGNAHTADSAADPRSQLIENILASPRFARSARLSAFLRYVSSCALEGRHDAITEQQIGIHVFKRPTDYDPGADNIVRSHARLLRQKLESYFREEGCDQRLHLEIPRGAYLPVFRERSPGLPGTGDEEQATGPALEQEPPGEGIRKNNAAKPGRLAFPAWRAAALLAAAGLVTWLLWLNPGSSPPLTPSLAPSPSAQLWEAMFPAARQTLIVPADSAYVLLQNLTERSYSLDEFVSGSYLANLQSPYNLDSTFLENIGRRQYTSMADVNFLARLLSLPAARRGKPAVRFSRFLHLQDLKHSNVILIGVKQANPWVELYEDNLNFQFGYGKVTSELVVSNRAPLAGEAETYRNFPDDPKHRIYASIAYLPSLGAEGHVLIVQGTTMAGTEAAADFVSDAPSLDSALAGLTTADQPLRHFELFIESTSVANNARTSRVVSRRVVPQ